MTLINNPPNLIRAIRAIRGSNDYRLAIDLIRKGLMWEGQSPAATVPKGVPVQVQSPHGVRLPHSKPQQRSNSTTALWRLFLEPKSLDAVTSVVILLCHIGNIPF
jgi:hypothetical protein